MRKWSKLERFTIHENGLLEIDRGSRVPMMVQEHTAQTVE
jgi:hypothetical protein